MKSNRNKILLAALIVGIPAVTTLVKSQQSNAMLRPAAGSVKNMVSMLNKTALTKPTVAPKLSSVKMANKNLVSNRVSMFNNTNQAKTTGTVKRSQSVGKLNLNTSFASNLDSLLGVTTNKTGSKKPQTGSVNKLKTETTNKLSSLLGGSSGRGSSLDLSKLPETPPPPPTQTQGTSSQTSSATQLTSKNTLTSSTTPAPIPDAPPLPPQTSTNTNVASGGGNLKNQLSSKLNSGLKKAETNSTLKPTTAQDDLLKELKFKLKLRT